jgi:hypothetical protein
MYVAPADAWHVPSPDRLEAAWTHFRTHINRFVSPLEPATDFPQFHVDLENLPEPTCPNCRHVHPGQVVVDVFGPVYSRLREDPGSPRSLDIVAPCCGAHITLDAFEYPAVELRGHEGDEHADWKVYRTAGFSRVDICLWDHDLFLNAAQRDDMARLLGCPIQLIWHHF